MVRFRKTLSKEIARNKHRAKSFLYYHGIVIPDRFANRTRWSKRFTAWLEGLDLPTESFRATLTLIIDLVLFIRAEQYETLKNIKALSRTERYRKDVELLMDIPGIGLITAMVILTELVDISRLVNLDGLCSYIGLVPMTNSSGTSIPLAILPKDRTKRSRA